MMVEPFGVRGGGFVIRAAPYGQIIVSRYWNQISRYWYDKQYDYDFTIVWNLTCSNGEN